MKVSHIFFLLILTSYACTPKTAKKVETPAEPEVVEVQTPDEDLSPCKNWENASNKDELMSAHVLYKDRLREIKSLKRKDAAANESRIDELYGLAFDYWSVVFEGAPAADGRRPDHFDDGVKIYEHFYAKATTEAEKKIQINKIMGLYDERAECYGDKAYMLGAKAFDYYYKYPEMKTQEENYQNFKASMDMYKNKADYFILNPFTALLSNMIIKEKISLEEGKKYAGYIRNSLAHGLANAKTERAKEPWLVVQDYVPAILDQLEGVKGFYDCNHFKEKYLTAWRDNPNDCDAIVSVIGKMRWGGCADSDSDLSEARAAYNSNCRQEVVTSGPSCRSFLQDGNYQEAIDCYSEKGANAADATKRAQYNLFVAKIYYGELKRYADARKYARKALKDRPNWGEPYILIGKLYASSGPLCGSGRGWKSQVVTWPAIDKWKKAKAVDSSVASEANKLINKYRQYMPSVEDIFQRQLKEGDSFTVPCWIQESTRVRPAPKK